MFANFCKITQNLAKFRKSFTKNCKILQKFAKIRFDAHFFRCIVSGWSVLRPLDLTVSGPFFLFRKPLAWCQQTSWPNGTPSAHHDRLLKTVPTPFLNWIRTIVQPSSNCFQTVSQLIKHYTGWGTILEIIFRFFFTGDKAPQAPSLNSHP